jgi:glucose-1-phosphate cytidylyltransferase
VKCVILAGGRGTRISEESHLRPKPMIEIGDRPLLWHIMKGYAQQGVTEFVICLGYKGYMIKEYFFNYFLHSSDVTVDIATNTVEYHDTRTEPWRVTLVDSGESTMTGGRVLRARRFLEPDRPFCFTYGDGLADVDISAQLEFHERHGRLVTMTVVRPPSRFGRTVVDGERVVSFEEKPQASGGLINGGFFVVSPGALEFIDGDDTPWEAAPLERLSEKGELAAWRHDGFWQPMDTLRDKEFLQTLWEENRAPWRVWEEPPPVSADDSSSTSRPGAPRSPRPA